MPGPPSLPLALTLASLLGAGTAPAEARGSALLAPAPILPPAAFHPAPAGKLPLRRHEPLSPVDKGSTMRRSSDGAAVRRGAVSWSGASFESYSASVLLLSLVPFYDDVDLIIKRQILLGPSACRRRFLLASTSCTSPSCLALTKQALSPSNPDPLGSTPFLALYDPKSSSSFKEVDGNATRWAAAFADGTRAEGWIARERVGFGGVLGEGNETLVRVDDQAIGLITNTNLTLAAQRVSGLLGLGFSRLSHLALDGGQPPPTLLEGLVKNGTLAAPLFGLYLERNSTAGGSLTLGAIDSSVVPHQSLLQWHSVAVFPPFLTPSTANSSFPAVSSSAHSSSLPTSVAAPTSATATAPSNSSFISSNIAPPVSPYLHWALPLAAVSVGSSSIALSPPSFLIGNENHSLALLDAGTEGLFGPLADVAAVFEQINGARMVADGQWIAPCKTLQTISFSFGGRNYALQPSDWMRGRVESNPAECMAWPVALPEVGDGIGWQLGAPFLRTVYTAFHLGVQSLQSPLIGLYPLRNTSSLLTDTADSLSAALDSYPTIAFDLPNVLLPLPVWETPTSLFNVSAWYSAIPVTVTLALSAPLTASNSLPALTTSLSTSTAPIATALPSSNLTLPPSALYSPLPLTFIAPPSTSLPSSTSSVLLARPSSLAKESALPTALAPHASLISALAPERSSLVAKASAAFASAAAASSASPSFAAGSTLTALAVAALSLLLL